MQNQIRPPNKRDDIIALLTDLLEGRDILDQDSRFKAVLICGQLLSDVHSLVESEWSRKQRKQWRIVLKSALQLLVEVCTLFCIVCRFTATLIRLFCHSASFG